MSKKKNIPYSTQLIGADDIKEVVRVLKSGWLTQGPAIEKFETAVADFCTVKYAVTVSSGTAALHSACFAIGLKAGDEVIVPTLSFAASANCVAYLGAKPVLVDVVTETGNIDTRQIENNITNKTRAIIGVDFAGHPASWDEILQIAKKNKLVTIDDAAHSLGSLYKGSKVGSLADLTVFSFHPVKTITSGEGGMVVTNNKFFFERIKRFRHHGMIKTPKLGGWYHKMIDLGYNYRMTDIQAALGHSQLKKIDKFIKKRREIHEKYNEAFESLSFITCPKEKPDVKAAWHLYTARFNLGVLKRGKKRIYDYLKSKELGVQVHYIPVHLHPYYQKNLGYKKGQFPVAEKYYEGEISLPLFPKMTDKDVNYVIEIVKSLKDFDKKL